jgi:hypothetical protein
LRIASGNVPINEPMLIACADNWRSDPFSAV